MTAEQIIALLQGIDFRGIRDEKELQAHIQSEFRQRKIEHLREFNLSAKHKIDFMIGTIGIEVKIKGQALAIARQLQDYAQYDKISELILFTTKRFNMFEKINGKKVHNIWKIQI